MDKSNKINIKEDRNLRYFFILNNVASESEFKDVLKMNANDVLSKYECFFGQPKKSFYESALENLSNFAYSQEMKNK